MSVPLVGKMWVLASNEAFMLRGVLKTYWKFFYAEKVFSSGVQKGRSSYRKLWKSSLGSYEPASKLAFNLLTKNQSLKIPLK